MNIWPHCSRAGKKKNNPKVPRREKYSPAPVYIHGGSASPTGSTSLLLSPETKRNCNSKKRSYMAGWQTWGVRKCFHVRQGVRLNERLSRKGWLGICRCQLCRAGQVPARGDGHRTRALSCASLFSCWSLHILSGNDSEGSGGLWQLRFLHHPSVLSGRCKGKGGMKGLQCFLCPLPRNRCSLEVSTSFPSCPPPPQFQN